MLRHRTLHLLSALLLVGLVCDSASAARRHRRRFEATDLEQENPGELNLDLEAGIISERAGGYRAAVPDFEIGMGFDPQVELILDSAYFASGPDLGSASLKGGSFDNLWTSARLAIFGDDNDVERTGWAFGAQLGPKLPIARDATGAGYEGVAIFAFRRQRLHLLFNAGGVLEPGTRGVSGHPVGLEGALDTTLALDALQIFALDVEFAGVHYFSGAPAQASVTLGLQWAATPALDLALEGIAGLAGDDRYGVLLQVAPTFALWQ